MKFIRFFLSLLSTFLLFYLLDTRLSHVPLLGRLDKNNRVPALGSFLNPFEGFWANAESKNLPTAWKANLPQLKDKVEVLFDEKLVPHIFANNEHDLYFMQGYAMAKLRLWQMEFISLVAAGRLSEVVGERALTHDRTQRRMGMLYAAELSVKEMQKDSVSRLVVESFAEGVNAYIAQLAPKDYPIEYKLMGYAPEKWTPIKTALISKYMAQDLAMRTDDVPLTEALERFGKDAVNELFPQGSRYQSPIIPEGTKFDFRRVPVPKVPKEISYLPNPTKEKKGDRKAFVNADAPKENNGSNNWAISGEKSSTGLPMLANDPHLTLRMPSIWIEMQLVAPRVNVYGVSVVGVPCIMIGFNQEIAWGVTNVDADVQDWYKIKFQDATRKAYWHDKKWKSTTTRKEIIKVRGGKTIAEEVIFTHHGPVVALDTPQDTAIAHHNRFPVESALRWAAHDASNELMTIYKLNRARNYDDYRRAIAFFSSPAQNFIFADVHNDIAITPNGKFPLKWRGQGKFVLDGSNPEHDWQGWIPTNQNPHVKNPERGFVSSANQFPTDSLYPYYLHWRFVRYDRGARINQRLAAMEKATADSMRLLQYDSYSMAANEVLPTLLKYTDGVKWSAKEQKALQLLRRWDKYYKANQTAPTLYYVWWNNLLGAIWDDELGKLAYQPVNDRSLEFVMAGDSLGKRWFDDIRTPKVETLADLVRASWRKTVKDLEERFKNSPLEDWTWAAYRSAYVQHLLRLPAFSVQGLTGDGDRSTVNATAVGNHGPSWRMVVALGRTPKGYGIFPGGQSGNPGSHFYANFIGRWQKGELNELYYMRKAERNSKIITYWKLTK